MTAGPLICNIKSSVAITWIIENVRIRMRDEDLYQEVKVVVEIQVDQNYSILTFDW